MALSDNRLNFNNVRGRKAACIKNKVYVKAFQGIGTFFSKNEMSIKLLTHTCQPPLVK